MTVLLGIDIGTSSTKALTLNADSGEILTIASAEHTIHKPQADFAEQHPDDWWQAVVQTVRQVVANTPGEIAAIGFSGQMHGTVLLDANQQPLHRAIIWADQRAGQVARDMQEQQPEAFQVTGTQPASGFMGATLVWLAQHQPDLLSQAHTVLLPKDMVRLKMTGQVMTDTTDAAGTALFDVRQQVWADDIVDAYGLRRDLLPPVQPSFEVAGELQPEAADELGLVAGIPVVTGCADQPAQALGNGITRPGIASVTVGSGGQIFIPVEASQAQMDSRLHVFCHATGDLYALGATLSAGLSLRWLRDVLHFDDNSDAFSALSQAAADIEPGAEGLLFLPYLNGERTPHMDASARGAFIGLSMQHTRAHLARAIMEGVAFSLRQAYDICQTVGQRPETLVLSGGGAESSLWRQIITDVFQQPLVKSQRREQAALGAAILAGVGIGQYGDDTTAWFDAARRVAAQYDTPTQPQSATKSVYNERYDQFKRMYPLLKPEFDDLTG